MLQTGSSHLGITLSGAQLAAFDRYSSELIEWNQRFNLTAVRDPKEIERLLFLDSLTVALVLKTEAGFKNHRLLDVGSGAGIPGLPLKLAFPDLDVTLLEATRKKVQFLEHVANVLDLSNGVHVINARAEAAAHLDAHREQYDYVTSRAVGSLRILAELCLPFARIGGLVIAPKGADAQREVKEAAHALATLGGQVKEILPINVPELPLGRNIVVIAKTSPTPPAYPRRAGIPVKRPL